MADSDVQATAPAQVHSGAPQAVVAMRSPYLVVDDFLPIELANAMRNDIDHHFANPEQHRAESHQIWNYWYVPESYTYLRTNPEKIMPREYVETFMDTLRAWCIDKLGMNKVTAPYLSMYVPGCRQVLHNDSANGRFAFVYSLTRNERLTSGGETIVFHEGDPFRSKLTQPGAGRGFFDMVAPRFNRLVLFDDRMPHGVERIDGSMDPVEGRFVFHGHVSEGGAIVVGPLPLKTVREVAQAAVVGFNEIHKLKIRHYHGPLVFRLTVSRTGAIDACDVLVDRVSSPQDRLGEWKMLVANLVDAINNARFPAAPTSSIVTLPFVFGGSLPTPT